MMNEAKMTELSQAEEMAYFRADLCLDSPESYTLDEKKEICNDMMSTSKAMLDAMREDFESMPPELRSKLLDMLCESGVESPQWW
jgi:actin-like ATPase involved in cell morphogenesis